MTHYRQRWGYRPPTPEPQPTVADLAASIWRQEWQLTHARMEFSVLAGNEQEAIKLGELWLKDRGENTAKADLLMLRECPSSHDFMLSLLESEGAEIWKARQDGYRARHTEAVL